MSINPITGKYETDDNIPSQRNLKLIENIIDVIYIFEIVLCFFKKTRAQFNLYLIGMSYIKSYFIFDFIATLPLCMFQQFEIYWLKCFKIIHITRLTLPLEVILSIALQKYSKKR